MVSALACRLWIDVREARSSSDMAVVLRDAGAPYPSFAVLGDGNTLDWRKQAQDRGRREFPPDFPTSLMG